MADDVITRALAEDRRPDGGAAFLSQINQYALEPGQKGAVLAVIDKDGAQLGFVFKTDKDITYSGGVRAAVRDRKLSGVVVTLGAKW